MQLRYVFTELGNGLRRNLSMHLAVILTLFVSLTLVGVGVLLNQEAHRVADRWGSQLQVAVYLCSRHDGNPACTGEVTDAQQQADPEGRRHQHPGVELPHRVASRRRSTSSTTQYPGKYDGPNSPITAAGHARVDLDHAQEPQPVPRRRELGRRARRGLAGPGRPQDAETDLQHDLAAQVGRRSATAAFLVIAALLLVANTIRLAAFARRREIGIMRLVGASTLYIALPFLLEALVTAVLGVALAGAGVVGLHGVRRCRAS